MTTYKKQTGIWLDYDEAYLVMINEEKGGEPVIKHLLSQIDHGVPKGGSRSKTPWGPQHSSSERGFEDRRHREEKAFFEAIVREIDPATDELVIFGPAQAKFGLQNMFEAIKHYHPKLMGIYPADSMTTHQITAWVREFFAGKMVH